ncbi:MAG: PilW family protein [Candidatus Methylomirabilales bacterium]
MRAWREAVKTAERGPSSPRLRGEAGVSLLEVVIALVTFAVVLGGIYSLLLSNQAVYARGQISFDMHTNAQFALPPITRALLSAGLDPTETGTFGFVDNPDAGYIPTASDTQLTFTLDANGDGVLQNNPTERQGFRLTGAGPPFTLERMVIGGGGIVGWTSVARQVQRLQFLYFDAQGTPLPNPATPPYTLTVSQRQLIRRIVVQVTVGRTGTGLLGGRQYSHVLSSAVTPRNLRGL